MIMVEGFLYCTYHLLITGQFAQNSRLGFLKISFFSPLCAISLS